MFKGVLSPVVGLAGLNALLFVSYGSLLRYLHPPAQETQPTLWQIYLAGAGAGFACFFFSTPTELVKIQAQMTKLPKSTLQVTREIYAMHGWKGNFIILTFGVSHTQYYCSRLLSRWSNYHDP